MRRRSFSPLFWLLAELGSRVRYVPTVAAPLTTQVLQAEFGLEAPTRHGSVRVVVVRPVVTAATVPPPVVVQLHGGGFLNRYPEQDRHIARFLATRLGVVVVLPDYSTAPKVRYPVAEEQMLDVTRWVRDTGEVHGWAGDQLLLSGISAGAKLAINVCQQLHAAGEAKPIAVSLIVPVTDMTRADRTSAARRPAISPFVQRLVAWAYVPDEGRRREPLATPRYDDRLSAAMPPTLVQTARSDTLAPEGVELAAVLHRAGVEVVHRQYEDADHGFYASGPVERVEHVLTEITTFFTAHIDRPVTTA